MAQGNIEIPSCRFYCTYVRPGTEDKFSGGYYDQKYISDRKTSKFDEYFAIVYVICGTGEYTDYRGRIFPIAPGCLIVRHAGKFFNSFKKVDADGRWLEFAAALPRSFYTMLMEAAVINEETTYMFPGLNSELIKLSRNYVDAMEQADTPAGRAWAYGAFLEFFSAAMSLWRRHEYPETDRNKQLLDQARALLSNNFERHIDIRELSGQLGMSYESFRKNFRHHCGISPNEYRILRRLDRADALLLHTELSIKEVALQLGYSAVSSFTRQYAAFRGTPPSTVRQRTAEVTAIPSAVRLADHRVP